MFPHQRCSSKLKCASCCRHAGGQNPCPEIDFDKGFNDIMAAAFDLKGTVKKEFGAPFGKCPLGCALKCYRDLVSLPANLFVGMRYRQVVV
jgi:hypothetical protein